MTKLRWLAPILLLILLGPGCGADREEHEAAPAIEPPPAVNAPEESAEDRAIRDLVSSLELRDFGSVVRDEKKFAEDFPESPRRAEALYLSGRASLGMGHFDEAEATFRKILELYPKDEKAPFADFYVAQAIYLKGHVPASKYEITREEAFPQYEKALEAFRGVAERRAGDEEVVTRSRLMIAQVLHDLGRLDKALAGFQAYLEGNPTGDLAAEAIFQTGAILSELGRVEEARNAFIRVTKDYPGNPQAGRAVDQLRELNLVGNPMPPLRVAGWLTPPDGPPRIEGKVVLLIFWNVRCPHCKQEMPKLDALYRKLEGRGLVALGLTSPSHGETQAEILRYIMEHKLSLPIGIDQAGQTSSAFAVGEIPAVAIVDRKGIVRWRNSGGLVTESLLKGFL
jgi:TolA-binding protein/thiol-disulfide isomerase/thioredoxin